MFVPPSIPWPCARRASSSFRWPLTASSGCTRTPRWLTPWMTAPRCCWSVPSVGRPAIWATTAMPGERSLEPLAAGLAHVRHDVLAPLGVPRHPLLMARFGMISGDFPARRLAEAALSRAPRPRSFCRTGRAFHAATRSAPKRRCRTGFRSRARIPRAGPFHAGGAHAFSVHWPDTLRSLGGEVTLSRR